MASDLLLSAVLITNQAFRLFSRKRVGCTFSLCRVQLRARPNLPPTLGGLLQSSWQEDPVPGPPP